MKVYFLFLLNLIPMLCNVVVCLPFSKAVSSDGDIWRLPSLVVILINLLKKECVCFTFCYYPNKIQNQNQTLKNIFVNRGW